MTNADIGKDVKADKLLKEFDRVLLCCGAANPRDIKAEGRDAKGIYFAVDFLASVTKSLLDSNLRIMPTSMPRANTLLSSEAATPVMTVSELPSVSVPNL